MAQLSFSDAACAVKRKQTRREKFLTEMDTVVPWDVLPGLIEPTDPEAGQGHRPYTPKAMLCEGMIVDATIIHAAPRPRTRPRTATRHAPDPQEPVVPGQPLPRCLTCGIDAVVGMKAHIRVDVKSGLGTHGDDHGGHRGG